MFRNGGRHGKSRTNLRAARRAAASTLTVANHVSTLPMIRFLRKPRILLNVTMGGEHVGAITDRRLPAEILPTVSLQVDRPTLELSDSAGNQWHYDLGSAIREGATYGHLSVRVNETFAAEADCLLSTSATVPTKAFRDGRAKGVRFQPFYLPECAGNPADLVGRGLFFRGFHFSGTITPGNVSLLCICDVCRHCFRLQSFHAGFANLVYFYCGSGVHTLVASAILANAPPLLADEDEAALAAFESQLPPCAECGTHFRYYNTLRCPHCRAPYIDFGRFPSERKSEYYGNHFYGTTLQEFVPDAG